MTRVLPLRAFRCPVAGDARGDAGWDVALVTSPGPAVEGTIPDGSVPLFGDRSRGGFLVLRQDYQAASGSRKSRLALVALLEPIDGAGGTIKPALDVEPRDVTSLLAELERARTQVEPVIAAFEDPRLELDKILERASGSGGEPEVDEEGLDSDRLRLWKIESGPLIHEITRFFENREIYLIDGLHVYRAYRRLNDARERCDGHDGRGKQRDCPLTVFANLCDFGVSLTAHHLLIKDLPPLDINELVLRLSPFFHMKSFPFEGARDLSEVLRRFRDEFRVAGFTENTIGACFSGNAQLFLFRLREDVDRERLFLPDVRREHHDFDAFLLRHVILDRYIWAGRDGREATTTVEHDCEYARTIEEAVHSVTSGRCQAAFLLNPPTKRRLIEFLSEGLRLPPGAVALDPPVPGGLMAHLP